MKKYDDFSERDAAIKTAIAFGQIPADTKLDNFVILFRPYFGADLVVVAHAIDEQGAIDACRAHRKTGAQGEYVTKRRSTVADLKEVSDET